MSFGVASRGRHDNRQYTTLWLIGGNNCDPADTPGQRGIRNVDLKVKGGAIIRQDLCVDGNIYGNIVSDNICLEKITSDVIQGKTGNTVTVESNLIVSNTFSFITNTGCIVNGKIDALSTVTSGGNLVILSDTDHACGNIGNVHMIEVEIIANKRNSVTGDILILPEGNTIIESKTGKTMIADDVCIEGNTTLELLADGMIGFAKIDGNGTIFKDNTVGNIVLDGNLDMKCFNISNVEVLQANTIVSKSINVDFDSPINMTMGGERILFEGGIIIGNINTATIFGSGIAIGDGAVADGEDHIALGRHKNTANANAIATAWGQTFQNREWADGMIGFARIDAWGNIFKDNNANIPSGGNVIIEGNLDMQCFNISNVEVLEVNIIKNKKVGDDLNLLAESGNICVNAMKDIKLSGNTITFSQYNSQFPSQRKFMENITTSDSAEHNIVCVPTCGNTVVYVSGKITALSDNGNALAYKIECGLKNFNGTLSMVGGDKQEFIFVDNNAWSVILNTEDENIKVNVQATSPIETVNWCALIDIYYWNNC